MEGSGANRQRCARSGAAWNGHCGHGAEPTDQHGNGGERAEPRNHPVPDGTCNEPGNEEGDEEPGKGNRRVRRKQRQRSVHKEKEENGGRGRLKERLEAALNNGNGRSEPGTGRGWTRRAALRAARGLRAGGESVLRLLGTVCAVMLLLVVLLIGAIRLCWRMVINGGRAMGRSRLAELLDAAVIRRIIREDGTWRRIWVRWRRRTAQEPQGGCGVMGDAVAGCELGAPGSSEEEVSRLLAMAEGPEEELNPFQALGVEATASDAELRKAYRRLAVLVHPDKSQHPRAEEAFKVLRAAWDIVSSPERRKEYEIKRMAESELSRSVSEFLSRLQDDLKEAMNTMMCSKCQGKHRRFEMDRDPLSARYCAECSQLHPAEEGDLWAESSLLGLKITYFAMMDGKVYDITEWAGCQRVGICPDTHRVPYHISFGVRSAGAGGRQRSTSKGSPSSADLQDFFTRMFQGTSGQVPGGFPPPPTPTAPQGATAGTTRTEGTVPKGDTKHKRRKKVRRPFQR